jgi:3-hydroxymyristoyl/3-hydroxydecanoyl-(acyl carrier protein) dehydratase
MTTTTDLQAMLPWSQPFLMVDRLMHCAPYERAVTCKQVTASDSVAAGGESGDLFFPSVLVLEGLSQSAALLFRLSYGSKALSGAPLLGYLKARFRGSVRPGDTLLYTVTAIKMTSRSGVFAGVARVGATEIATTELAFSVGAP